MSPYQAYRRGQEEQLGALGLVVNAVTLWNSRYVDRAVGHLRDLGQILDDGDLERISPLIQMHTSSSTAGIPSTCPSTSGMGNSGHSPTTAASANPSQLLLRGRSSSASLCDGPGHYFAPGDTDPSTGPTSEPGG
ncbi:MAG: transposase [Actinobacteria bacterium]|nr:transposase [Actinomycetota bacterium]